MFYSDDPERDFLRWDAQQQNELKKLPVCADCDNPIQDESAFYINGEWICEDCMEAYRMEVDDYLE
jgi:formylmethanofuran dehydrogenase subunit E